MDFLIRDAFFHAISLEKIGGIQMLTKSDSIFVYPCISSGDSSYSYRKELADKLPIHVDNWVLQPIKEREIYLRATNNEFHYLIFYIEFKNSKAVAQFILDTELPQDKQDLLLIDRPRLSVIFKHEGSSWKIDRIVGWYG